MRIRDIRSAVVAVPLAEPTAFAKTLVTAREYVLVWVEADDGSVGLGFTVGGRREGEGHLIRTAVEHLAPMVVGEPVHAPERVWQQMFDGSILVGRRGAVVRAMSAIDIGLWDLIGRDAGRPLSGLLGGFADPVPAYASGGYYRDGKDIDGLVAEVERYLALGFTAVKVKVGRLDLAADVARVRAVREAIGADVRLALDANNAWPDARTAVRAVRRFEPFDPWWIEEPLMPDDVAGHAALAAAVDVPVATGEIEATRWGFRPLMDANGVDIVQADATVCGGVTEWLKIAHAAALRDLPVAPHWMANLHVHLVGAVPNGLAVEYFVLDEDVFNFERLVTAPLRPEDGRIPVPPLPGHGVVLDLDAVARFRLEGDVPTILAVG